jgi:hypothetical protein
VLFLLFSDAQAGASIESAKSDPALRTLSAEPVLRILYYGHAPYRNGVTAMLEPSRAGTRPCLPPGKFFGRFWPQVFSEGVDE